MRGRQYAKQTRKITLPITDKNLITPIKRFFFLARILYKRFWVVLELKERYILVFFAVLFLFSLFFLGIGYWLNNTELIARDGGEYREAIVGSPRYINPVLAPTNEADRDLSQLIFSGLMKYDTEGNVAPDLAKDYKIEDGGKAYIFSLREGVRWHDGVEFNSDDIVFTIKTIQDPKYQSPLRINWQGVKVEKIDNLNIKFTLTNPYAPFIENATVGILPKHIWQDVQDQNFPLAEANLKPIGTGPYKFKKLSKDKTGLIKRVILEVNKDHYERRPFIKELDFRFFDTQNEAIENYNRKAVDGISFVFSENLAKIKSTQNLNLHQLFLPRYFAVFFNQTQSKALAKKQARLALAHATDKETIINEVLRGYGRKADSPILPGLLGYAPDIKIYDFALEHAKNLLTSAGWKDLDEDGVLEIEEARLEFDLVTTESSELTRVANILKNQWERLGAKINVTILGPGEIQQDFIRPRNFEALLFGEVLGHDPDPFSFWHSSQKKDPGLNLALYDNKKVDELLEDARQTLNTQERARKYEEFQRLLVEDIPAIFLYSPDYIYPVNQKVKGIEVKNIVDPSKRFVGIEGWYIKTKRVWR